MAWWHGGTSMPRASKRHSSTCLTVTEENSLESAVLVGGALEEGEQRWHLTGLCETTQIVWMYEISDRASETKTWERKSRYFISWGEIYLPQGLLHVFSLSLRPYPLSSVSNSFGPSLLDRVLVETELFPNRPSGSSIHLNDRLGYGWMEISQPFYIGQVVSGSPSGSICRCLYCPAVCCLIIVS